MGDMTYPHAIEVAKDEVGEAGYTPPATWYVALLVTITDAKVPTIVECSDANYARQEVDAWDAVDSAGHTQNTNAITFPALAAGQTFVGWALFAALSGGTAKYVKAISDWVVGAGVEPYLPAGALDLTFS